MTLGVVIIDIGKGVLAATLPVLLDWGAPPHPAGVRRGRERAVHHDHLRRPVEIVSPSARAWAGRAEKSLMLTIAPIWPQSGSAFRRVLSALDLNNVPWNLLICAALGIWVLFVPTVFGATERAAASSGCGSLTTLRGVEPESGPPQVGQAPLDAKAQARRPAGKREVSSAQISARDRRAVWTSWARRWQA